MCTKKAQSAALVTPVKYVVLWMLHHHFYQEKSKMALGIRNVFEARLRQQHLTLVKERQDAAAF